MKSRKMRILFRTYGGKIKNKQTGLGHIYRCINLGHELKKHAQVYFLVEDYGGSKKIICDNNFVKVSTLSKNISDDLDIQKTLEFVKKNKIDLVVVDKHKITKRYVKKIKNHTKIAVITDLNETSLPADILINGYIGLKNQKFKNLQNTLCLLGPKYQILNQKFSKIPIQQHKKYDILVTFGALDEKCMVDVFLNSLNQFSTMLKIKIILGPIASQSKLVTNFSKKFPKNITYVKETQNMKKEIIQSKFGFTAGGITSYEFASMKIPFAIICDSKHQIPTAIEWEKKNLGYNLGFIDKNTSSKISALLELLLAKNFLKPTKNNYLVDGHGIIRISKEVLKLLKSN